MSTSVCSPNDSTSHCIANRIVVMDDNERIQEIIAKGLKEKIDGDIWLASSQDEVVEIAKEDECMGFILDIDMGEGRTKEGFQTLKDIRQIDKDTPIFILSNHSQEKYKKRIREYNASFKSKENIKKSISQIANDLLIKVKSNLDAQIIEYERKLAKFEAEVSKYKGKIEICKKERRRVEGNTKLDSFDIDKTNDIKHEDINFSTYEKLRLNSNWLQQFGGKYVAFLEGKQLSKSFYNQESIINWIRESIDSNKEVFITKVTLEDEEIIELPISLLFDNMI